MPQTNHSNFVVPTLFRRLAAPLAVGAAVLASTGPVAAASPSAVYAVTNLVSNGVVPTPYVDRNMVNTWGVSFNPTGLVWVTNNRTGTSTLYDGTGAVDPLVVVVPPAGSSGTGSPTGIVFSGTSDFAVTNGVASGPSRFIFASDDGLISGWAPNVDLHNAIRVVATAGADYKGLAIANSPTGARLYAADFKRGRVDMFDSQFRKIAATSAFIDPRLPRDLKPFNVQAINDQIYVTYTKPDGNLDPKQAIAGAAATPAGAGSSGSARPASSGSGNTDSVVNVFDSEGRYLRRAVAQNTLKQPWGVALAPADFGKYSNRLLIGDFHDGTISAYDNNGKLLGTLNDAKGKALKMPGLWGFAFGNGVNSQPTNTLFFAAGPNGQGGGVYGSVTAVQGR